MFGRFYLHFFVGGFMSYLRYLCLFAYSGVQHILCCVFAMIVFVLCLVFPMLPVSLDCQFLIAPSVFSNVYFLPLLHSMFHFNLATVCFNSIAFSTCIHVLSYLCPTCIGRFCTLITNSYMRLLSSNSISLWS